MNNPNTPKPKHSWQRMIITSMTVVVVLVLIASTPGQGMGIPQSTTWWIIALTVVGRLLLRIDIKALGEVVVNLMGGLFREILSERVGKEAVSLGGVGVGGGVLLAVARGHPVWGIVLAVVSGATALGVGLSLAESESESEHHQRRKPLRLKTRLSAITTGGAVGAISVVIPVLITAIGGAIGHGFSVIGGLVGTVLVVDTASEFAVDRMLGWWHTRHPNHLDSEPHHHHPYQPQHPSRHPIHRHQYNRSRETPDTPRTPVPRRSDRHRARY